MVLLIYGSSMSNNLVGADKSADFSKWYTNLITRTELIDYYDVSGCYILLPDACAIWEEIKQYIDAKLKGMGVKNVYFPLFVSEKALHVEKDHIEGFEPEVAWVTRSGRKDLKKPIAIRPTSETIIYPYFAKRIKSIADLPMKFNQWTNVVRWEFKHPTPFLRTREFLWQEGHTVYANKADAEKEVHDIIDLYRSVYEDILAVPVIVGRKSEKEKFAGAEYTMTVEAHIPGAGKAIQGATSHFLGQNFAKMCNIRYEGEKQQGVNREEELVLRAKMKSLVAEMKTLQAEMKELKKAGGSAEDRRALAGEISERRTEVEEIKATLNLVSKMYLPYQNSWGLTTRTIGVAIMVHSDNMGLVLPPKIAPTQVVIVNIPCADKLTTELMEISSYTMMNNFENAGIRAYYDNRTDKTPGSKFNHYELKGVPIRIEIGAKEIESQSAKIVCRFDGSKHYIPFKNIATSIGKTLNIIQSEMLKKASVSVEVTEDWDRFVEIVNEGKMAKVPWCESVDSEEDVIKKVPGIKTLCIVPDQMVKNYKCFTGSGDNATCWCVWGKSF